MFVTFLKREYERRTRINPRYSLRAFAKSLKIESSTLSQLLARRRKVTPTQALRILGALEVDSAMKSTLLLGVIEGRDRAVPDEDVYTVPDLNADGMDTWEFFGVFSLLEIESTVHEVGWIAQRLGSTPERISRCIAGLESQGYIRKEKERWELSPVHLTTPRKCGKEAVTKAVSEYIRLGDECLRAEPGEWDDFSGVTIALDSRKLPEAIRRIREFRRSLSDYLSDDPKDGVYRLNLQLFRLDRGSRD